MQFDDRLATVLRQKAAANAGARTQYRQLLDLLGRPREGRDPSLLAAARLRLESLSDVVSVRERADIIREQGRRLNDRALVAQFAEAEPDIAAATLSTARLTENEWLAVIPELPVRARGFLRLRRDLPQKVEDLLERLGIHDRALPLPATPEALVVGHEDASGDTGEAEDAHIVEGEYTEVEDAEPASTKHDRPDRETAIAAGMAAAAAATAAVEPEAERPETPAPETVSPSAESQPRSEIAALLQRIDAFQRAREDRKQSASTGENAPDRGGDDAAAPTLPFGNAEAAHQELTGFGFATDTAGTIDWADSFAASRVLYLSLPAILPKEHADAIARQQPLRGVDVTLEGGPAIAGDWVLDAQPRFSSPDGRFMGWAGGMRRALVAESPDSHSDRLRQLLHELRTPVNAIQGFAEVIQQQMVGPVPHDYRALAAGIAGDSARMLAGFDDLERLSRLEGAQLRPTGGDADLAAIFRRHLGQLVPLLQPRNAGFVATLGGTCTVDLSREEAEQLSWRILATLGSAAAPGEKLALTLDHEGGNAYFVADLPASLAGSDDIFAARGKPPTVAISAGPFGAGFALRLARAEARAIGGSLRRQGGRLILTLPALTVDEPAATQVEEVPEHAI